MKKRKSKERHSRPQRLYIREVNITHAHSILVEGSRARTRPARQILVMQKAKSVFESRLTEQGMATPHTIKLKRDIKKTNMGVWVSGLGFTPCGNN
jgi:hypothetical protein